LAGYTLALVALEDRENATAIINATHGVEAEDEFAAHINIESDFIHPQLPERRTDAIGEHFRGVRYGLGARRPLQRVRFRQEFEHRRFAHHSPFHLVVLRDDVDPQRPGELKAGFFPGPDETARITLGQLAKAAQTLVAARAVESRFWLLFNSIKSDARYAR
jgi:hypothetical protein